MKSILPVFFIFLSLLSITVHGQQILKEKEFEFKKQPHDFDVPYVIAQEGNQFIMLQEVKKNQMKLGRYDHYFFTKWEQDVKLNITERVPQLHQSGDRILVYTIFHNEKIGALELDFQIFNRHTGKRIDKTDYKFIVPENEFDLPVFFFNDSFSKFAILSLDNAEKNYQYQIHQLGDKLPLKKYTVQKKNLAKNLASNAFLDEKGNMLLTTVEANSDKVYVCFWSAGNGDISQVESRVSLENTVEEIGTIDIIRQGASSYFITITAQSENGLTGFSVLGVNVILKYVMFSHHHDFTQNNINEIYQDIILTSEELKKEMLSIPDQLIDFRLAGSFKNAINDVILIFEELEQEVTYHQNLVNHQLEHKRLPLLNKSYKGGDVLLLCFTVAGELKWQKAIQKYQVNNSNSNSLSFMPMMEGSQLYLLCQDDSDGGEFYLLSMNTIRGSLTEKINLFPGKKHQYIKRYSSWLSSNKLLICITPPNILNKRKLITVQY